MYSYNPTPSPHHLHHHRSAPTNPLAPTENTHRTAKFDQTIDTKSAMGKFFFTLMAALAEMERDLISERTKAALQHKRANGEKTGGDVPFGYQADNGTLKKDRREQRIIALIKKLKAQGNSLREIGRELERRHYKTKTGKTTWNPKTVAAIHERAA